MNFIGPRKRPRWVGAHGGAPTPGGRNQLTHTCSFVRSEGASRRSKKRGRRGPVPAPAPGGEPGAAPEVEASVLVDVPVVATRRGKRSRKEAEESERKSQARSSLPPPLKRLRRSVSASRPVATELELPAAPSPLLPRVSPADHPVRKPKALVRKERAKQVPKPKPKAAKPRSKPKAAAAEEEKEDKEEHRFHWSHGGGKNGSTCSFDTLQGVGRGALSFPTPGGTFDDPRGPVHAQFYAHGAGGWQTVGSGRRHLGSCKEVLEAQRMVETAMRRAARGLPVAYAQKASEHASKHGPGVYRNKQLQFEFKCTYAWVEGGKQFHSGFIYKTAAAAAAARASYIRDHPKPPNWQRKSRAAPRKSH
jgi:hypothetical protein